MPYFTDEIKFTLPVTQFSENEESTTEGWLEYAQQEGYSLQSREVKKHKGSVTQYRKVKI